MAWISCMYKFGLPLGPNRGSNAAQLTAWNSCYVLKPIFTFCCIHSGKAWLLFHRRHTSPHWSLHMYVVSTTWRDHSDGLRRVQLSSIFMLIFFLILCNQRTMNLISLHFVIMTELLFAGFSVQIVTNLKIFYEWKLKHAGRLVMDIVSILGLSDLSWQQILGRSLFPDPCGNTLVLVYFKTLWSGVERVFFCHSSHWKGVTEYWEIRV